MIDFPSKKINNKTYINIYKSKDLADNQGRRIRFHDDEDQQVAIFRHKGKLYCLWNICPHRHQDQIHNGIIRDGKVSCPIHGWTYWLDSGDNINPHQGLKNLDKYDIFEEDGEIWIEQPEVKIPKWRQSD